MASDAPDFRSGHQDRAALDLHDPDPSASWDITFFARRAQVRDAQTDLIKSSAIKLAESQKLLAQVDALLRR